MIKPREITEINIGVPTKISGAENNIDPLIKYICGLTKYICRLATYMCELTKYICGLIKYICRLAKNMCGLTKYICGLTKSICRLIIYICRLKLIFVHCVYGPPYFAYTMQLFISYQMFASNLFYHDNLQHV